LALQLWGALELDSFWRARLRPSREGTPWLKVLKTLVAYRLIDPGSEWRLHRQWFDASAMADLLQADFGLAEKNTLYRCLDKLVAHKDELNKFLVRRWGELFGAEFDVLLYDLTSTYFETDQERGEGDLRQFGYSRDKRGDCRQVVIALIVTPEGFPLSYEVMSGDTTDCTTLSGFLDRIEQRYGHAKRIWVMDRGIPTEDSLAKMRKIGASYLVGTPKGRLSNWSSLSWTSPGPRCAMAYRSSALQRTKTCTYWRRAMRASTRSAACAGSGCADSSAACRRSRLKRSRATSCS
jgi:Transposase DDE domain